MANIEDVDPAELRAWIKKLATDLLAIAELAMPDTFFASDSRCKFARKSLKNIEKFKTK